MKFRFLLLESLEREDEDVVILFSDEKPGSSLSLFLILSSFSSSQLFVSHGKDCGLSSVESRRPSRLRDLLGATGGRGERVEAAEPLRACDEHGTLRALLATRAGTRARFGEWYLYFPTEALGPSSQSRIKPLLPFTSLSEPFPESLLGKR